jgi:hypothetical protein
MHPSFLMMDPRIFVNVFTILGLLRLKPETTFVSEAKSFLTHNVRAADISPL